MNRSIYVGGLIILLAFCSISVAQDLPRILSGKISHVEYEMRVIVVKSEEKEMAFNVSEDTKIKTEYGEVVPLAELKKDMSITIEYMKFENSMKALSVKIATSPRGFGKKQKEKRKPIR